MIIFCGQTKTISQCVVLQAARTRRKLTNKLLKMPVLLMLMPIRWLEWKRSLRTMGKKKNCWKFATHGARKSGTVPGLINHLFGQLKHVLKSIWLMKTTALFGLVCMISTNSSIWLQSASSAKSLLTAKSLIQLSQEASELSSLIIKLCRISHLSVFLWTNLAGAF